MKKIILIIGIVFIGMILFSQTSDDYQIKIDSLVKVKFDHKLKVDEIEIIIEELKKQKNIAWVNEQTGKILIFTKDEVLFDIDNKSKELLKVGKGTRVLFVSRSESTPYYTTVNYNGLDYIAKTRMLIPLNLENKEREKQIVDSLNSIADSLAVVNAQTYVFSSAGVIYKSIYDFDPDERVEEGTEVLYVKEVKREAIANCLVIYKGEEYYTSKSILMTVDRFKQNQLQKKLRQENVVKFKQSLIDKYGSYNAKRILERKIWIGMTDELAIESWGKPNDINRSVGSWGVHEQWVYSSTYLYFENGILTSWQD